MSSGIIFRQNPDGSFSPFKTDTIGEENKNDSSNSASPRQPAQLLNLRLPPGFSFEVNDPSHILFVNIGKGHMAKQEEPKERTSPTSTENSLQSGDATKLRSTNITKDPKSPTTFTSFTTTTTTHTTTTTTTHNTTTTTTHNTTTTTTHNTTTTTTHNTTTHTTTTTTTTTAEITTKPYDEPTKQESLLKTPFISPNRKRFHRKRNLVRHDVMMGSPYNEKIRDLVQSSGPKEVTFQS